MQRRVVCCLLGVLACALRAGRAGRAGGERTNARALRTFDLKARRARMYLVKIAWHRPKADCGWLLEQCTGQLRTGGRKLTVAGPGLIRSSAQGPRCCGTQASRLAGRAFAPVLSATYATCALITLYRYSCSGIAFKMVEVLCVVLVLGQATP